MTTLCIKDTIVLNKSLPIPSYGIICAHPAIAKKIMEIFLKNAITHTDYLGYQIYIGEYNGKRIFVANTGIGAPSAAFLLEELVASGAKRIIRVGSNDSSFTKYSINLVQETTIPLGLKKEYQVDNIGHIKVDDYLRFSLSLKAHKLGIKLSLVSNEHADACQGIQGTSDMETGALYLLGKYYQLNYASILMSYPKHDQEGEYGTKNEAIKLENDAIKLALMSLIA